MVRKVRVLLALSIALAVLATILVLNFGGQHAALPPMPNPNGYDDFLKAGQAILGGPSDFPTLDRAGLEALVTNNVEPLRLLRLGLTLQCLMPTNSSMTNETVLLNKLADLKGLAQLLMAEGRLREIDGRPADGARSYLDVIRFGNDLSRGAPLIARLVGVACESMGCHALAKILPRLDPGATRPVLTELEKIDANHIAWADVLDGEREFVGYQPYSEWYPILNLLNWRQHHQSIEKALTRHNLVVAHERVLAGELALRCFQSEHGGGPSRLDDLVTNYLSRVPEDPFSGRPLVYRPIGTNWLLYSLGPDRVDDHGQPATRNWPVKGDITLDSTW